MFKLVQVSWVPQILNFIYGDTEVCTFSHEDAHQQSQGTAQSGEAEVLGSP